MDPGRTLPVPMNPLVGREAELAVARVALLDERVRLLTLTGPPGVGKTRLAVATASALAHCFPGGLWFVPLAPVTDAALVGGAIAAAIGLPDAGDRPLPARLAHALGDRRALLLLDNFEQVVDAAPVVGALLVACPLLQIVTTSRRRLRLTGEQELRVAPLAVPDRTVLAYGEGNREAHGGGSWVAERQGDGAVSGRAGATLTRAGGDRGGAADAPAVVLFAQRARAARANVDLDGENAAAVAEICRRLDGLPLALELAAARLRHLTVPALLERLAPALPLLTGGPRDAPARHQTLRQTIAWSDSLLSPSERVLFRRLGVFVGGYTAEAAAAVAQGWPAPAVGKPIDGNLGAPTSADGADTVVQGTTAPTDDRPPAGALDVPTPSTALDYLTALADHGLLQYEPGPAGGSAPDEARFGMLETVREYAAEGLERDGEAEAARRRHAAYFLGLAERAAGAAHGPDQGMWFDRLERERGNLRAALGWAIDRGDVDAAVRFVAVLRWFWEVRGHAAEGRRQTAAVLALPSLSSEAAQVPRRSKPEGLPDDASPDDGSPDEQSPPPMSRDSAREHRARALAVASHLAHVDGDLAAAAALGADAVAVDAGSGARRARADALLWRLFRAFRDAHCRDLFQGTIGPSSSTDGALPSLPGILSRCSQS